MVGNYPTSRNDYDMFKKTFSFSCSTDYFTHKCFLST